MCRAVPKVAVCRQLLVEILARDESVVHLLQLRLSRCSCSGSHLNNFALVRSDKLEQVFYLLLSGATAFNCRAKVALVSQSVEQLKGICSLFSLSECLHLLLRGHQIGV